MVALEEVSWFPEREPHLYPWLFGHIDFYMRLHHRINHLGRRISLDVEKNLVFNQHIF